MKNFATLSFFLLLAAPVLQAQKLATAKPEIALRMGFNHNRWDDSNGPTIGLEGFMPLAGRWGIAAGWQFGQNQQPKNTDFFYTTDYQPLRFFTSKIGLARTSKRGHFRFAGGLSHQYLPKPLADNYGFGFCGTGLTDEQLKEIERQYAMAQQLGKYGLNMLGGHLSGEFRWAMGKQMFGSIGAACHFLKPPTPIFHGSEFTAGMVEINVAVGLR